MLESSERDQFCLLYDADRIETSSSVEDYKSYAIVQHTSTKVLLQKKEYSSGTGN